MTSLNRPLADRVASPAPTWPVSVKGVAVGSGRRVLLLENERGEWELPGGRLETAGDDSPEHALEREIREETGWEVRAGPLIEGGTWIYEPIPGRRVLIITYGCTVLTPQREPVLSHEHKRVGLFTGEQAARLVMPERYQASIAAWLRQAEPGGS